MDKDYQPLQPNKAESEIDKCAYWNYRVIASNDDDINNHGIHEVYYDANDQIMSWTKNPVPIIADGISDMEEVLDMIHDAIKKPVLRVKDLEAITCSPP